MTPRFNVKKTMYFDRAVARSLDKATYTVLVRFGAFVRRRARSSLRRARQKRVAEMTPDEADAYAVRVAIAKRTGAKKPRRPEVISDPGEVPKLHKNGARSPLKTGIEFAYDPRGKSVIIGPEASEETRGDATQALEHGGTSRAKRSGASIRVAPRPFMRPAFDKELPNLRKWKNTVK